jgi:hypothetical protein
VTGYPLNVRLKVPEVDHIAGKYDIQVYISNLLLLLLHYRNCALSSTMEDSKSLVGSGVSAANNDSTTAIVAVGASKKAKKPIASAPSKAKIDSAKVARRSRHFVEQFSEIVSSRGTLKYVSVSWGRVLLIFRRLPREKEEMQVTCRFLR